MSALDLSISSCEVSDSVRLRGDALPIVVTCCSHQETPANILSESQLVI
jgi:hypothetical protein